MLDIYLALAKCVLVVDYEEEEVPHLVEHLQKRIVSWVNRKSLDYLSISILEILYDELHLLIFQSFTRLVSHH